MKSVLIYAAVCLGLLVIRAAFSAADTANELRKLARRFS